MLESIPTEEIYHYPKGTNIIVSAEEFMRRNIRRVCDKVIMHHGEPADTAKSYSLHFSYSTEPSLGECDRFKPEKDNQYPLCDKPDCLMAGTCGASAHMIEPEQQPGG